MSELLESSCVVEGCRGGTILNMLSKLGIHGYRQFKLVDRLADLYKDLAEAKGSDNVTVDDMKKAIEADESVHPFLDAIIKYLPFILAILAKMFNFPIPLPASEEKA
jgi:hypothetical protein